MKSHGPVARLTDIIEAIELIRLETEAISIGAFALDKRKQWVVERGLEIISEASRHLPESLKTRNANIPWNQVAGIGNIPRHDYERVAYDVIWRVVQDDLPPLESVCRLELKALGTGP